MSTNGGLATAKIEREVALARYYANPSVCKQCGKVIDVPEGHRIREAQRKAFCNRKCSAVFNRFLHIGIPLTKESRKKISEARKGHSVTENTKGKISQSLKGREGKPLTEKHKKALLEGRLKVGTSPEMRRKLSLNACSNKHKFNNFRHVPFIEHTRLDGTVVTLRGTYEVRFAKYLDGIGLDWVYAKPLEFIDKNGVTRYMLPDFFVPSLERYFDTKGCLTKECAEKIELVRAQRGIVVQLLFLKDIEALERGEKKVSDF